MRDVLRKEVLWSRHRLLVLAFVLLLLPGAFAATSVFFQHVLPKDAPVAVVGDDASDADRRVVTAALEGFSDPERYDSRVAAMTALEREQVYAVVTVPPGVADPATEEATVTIAIDGDVVPYREPSAALANVVRFSLDRAVEADVSVERRIVGGERILSSYLVPTFLTVVVMTYAFAYLPYNLARERRVLDRLRVEASLWRAFAGKLLFLAALLLVPMAVFAAVAAALGYDVAVLAPAAVVAYLLTFLALGSVAGAVTLVTDFDTSGRLANVLLLFGFLGFSGLVYPVGFFSAWRREVVRLVPTHYAVVVARSATLKGASAGDFASWLAGLGGFALACAGLLYVSTRYYEVVR